MSGVSQDVFAEPMLEGENYLQSYAKEIRKLIKEGTIPDLKEKKIFKVYSIQGSSFGSHRSIVLTADDQRFFTVELGVLTVDGVKRIYPLTKKLPSSEEPNLVYLGEIEGTAGDLISKAIAVMKKFGKYVKGCKDCQNYCNYYLEEIGLGDTKMLTDGDKAALATIAGGILAVLIKILRALAT